MAGCMHRRRRRSGRTAMEEKEIPENATAGLTPAVFGFIIPRAGRGVRDSVQLCP